MTAEELKQYLETKGISQGTFAEKIGKNYSLVSAWVNGKRDIPLYVDKYCYPKEDIKLFPTDRDLSRFFGIPFTTVSSHKKKTDHKKLLYAFLKAHTEQEIIEYMKIAIQEEIISFEEIKVILQKEIKDILETNPNSKIADDLSRFLLKIKK